MAFTSQDTEVVFRVLVAVLHFDDVAAELRVARSGDVALIFLSRVAGIRRPVRHLPPLRHPSRVWIHPIPFFEPRHGPKDATKVRTSSVAIRKRGAGVSPFGNGGADAPHDAQQLCGAQVPSPQAPAIIAVEETAMPKNTKEPRDAQPPGDTQKLYAHAYGSRLAKQVADELEGTRRKAAGPQKPDGKR
jgi:hypothetical protein